MNTTLNHDIIVEWSYISFLFIIITIISSIIFNKLSFGNPRLLYPFIKNSTSLFINKNNNNNNDYKNDEDNNKLYSCYRKIYIIFENLLIKFIIKFENYFINITHFIIVLLFLSPIFFLIIVTVEVKDVWIRSSTFIIGLILYCIINISLSIYYCDWNPSFLFYYLKFGVVLLFFIFILLQLFYLPNGPTYRGDGSLYIGLSIIPLLVCKNHNSNNKEINDLDETTITKKFTLRKFLLDPSFYFPTLNIYFDSIEEKILSSFKKFINDNLSSISTAINDKFQYYFFISFDFFLIWLVSLIPIIIFIFRMINYSTDEYNGYVSIFVLIVLLINEICLFNLDLKWPVISNTIIVDRIILILSGANFWIIGSSFILLSSSFLRSFELMNSFYILIPKVNVFEIDKVLTLIHQEANATNTKENLLKSGEDVNDIDENNVVKESSSVIEKESKFSMLFLLILQITIIGLIIFCHNSFFGLKVLFYLDISSVSWSILLWLVWLSIILILISYKLHKNNVDLYPISGTVEKEEDTKCEIIQLIKSSYNYQSIFCSCVMIFITALFSSVIFDIWIILPCCTLLPLALLIWNNFLLNWEAVGCPFPNYISKYYDIDTNIVQNSVIQSDICENNSVNTDLENQNQEIDTSTIGYYTMIISFLPSFHVIILSPITSFVLVLITICSSFPFQHGTAVLYLCLWILAVLLTSCVCSLWRVQLSINVILIMLLFISLIPTLIWAILAGFTLGLGPYKDELENFEVFLLVLISISLQLIVISSFIYYDFSQTNNTKPMSSNSNDTNESNILISQTETEIDVNNNRSNSCFNEFFENLKNSYSTFSLIIKNMDQNLKFLYYLLFSIFILSIVCSIVICVYLSISVGIAFLFLLFSISYAVILKLEAAVSINKVILTSYFKPKLYQNKLIVFFILCTGIYGVISESKYSFWWCTFSWVSLSVLFLIVGIISECNDLIKVYNFNLLVPVYEKVKSESEIVSDVSFQAFGILIFFLMMAIWGIWLSFVTTPSDIGVIIFVNSLVCIGIFIKYNIGRTMSEIKRLDSRGYFSDQILIISLKSSIQQVNPLEINNTILSTSSSLSNSISMTTDDDCFNDIKKLVEIRDKSLIFLNEVIQLYCSVSSTLSPIPFFGLWSSGSNNDIETNSSTELMDIQILYNAQLDYIESSLNLSKMYAIFQMQSYTLGKSNFKNQENKLVSYLKLKYTSMCDITTKYLNSIPEDDFILIMKEYNDFLKHKKEYDMRVNIAEQEEINAAKRRLDEKKRIFEINLKNKRKKLKLEKERLEKERIEKERIQKLLDEEENNKKESNNNQDDKTISDVEDNDETEMTNNLVSTFCLPLETSLREYIENIIDKYVDEDFDEEIQFNGINSGGKLNRLTDIYPNIKKATNDYGLPQNGVLPEQISQGALGDCYFLSAISTIVDRPNILKKLIPYSDPSKSVYAVRFYINGGFKIVIIDDYFPFKFKNPLYAKNIDGQSVWVMLLEKAYAKIHGSYPNIQGGITSQAMSDLTGGVPSSFDLESRSDANWEKLKKLSSLGHLLGAGSGAGKDTDISATGIAAGHAYSILTIVEVDRNKLIKMRNPWGRKACFYF
jgi:hypothetical protein